MWEVPFVPWLLQLWGQWLLPLLNMGVHKGKGL